MINVAMWHPVKLHRNSGNLRREKQLFETKLS